MLSTLKKYKDRLFLLVVFITTLQANTNAAAQIEASLLHDIQSHFPQITSADLSRMDEALASKLATGELPPLLIVFNYETYDHLPENFGTAHSRRSAIEQRLQLHRENIDKAYTDFDRELGKFSHAIQFTRSFGYVPVRTAVIESDDDLRLLLDHPSVLSLSADKLHYPVLTQSKVVINQPLAESNGFDGSGTTVAVLDTGVNYTRSEFGSCTAPGVPATCRVQYVQDFAPDDGQLDASGHGTGVSAIVAGVASAADLVVLDVFDGNSASSTNIVAAVDWVVANATTYNIVSANFSLSDGTENNSACDGGRGPRANPFKAAFDSLVTADVLPVAASGNDAYSSGISSPACVTPAFSVGATYDASYSSLGWSVCTDTSVVVDDIACFSNSGSPLDLLAPGAVISAGGTNSGGTSNAAPHVAAAAAMIKQQRPLSTLAEVEQQLKTTNTVLLDTRNGLSFPRLDLQHALDLTDTDNDGSLDFEDPDPLNPCNPSQFASPCTLDTDGDGKTDASEGESTDSDGDGTPDYLESASTDTDSDGVSDELDPANADPCNPSQFASPCTLDSDSDGKSDSTEGEFTDTDSDGILDYLESAILDSDSDGIVDELDPANSDPCIPSQFAAGCTQDTDGDGKTDANEGELTDTDSDGVPDYQESSLVDSDNDGLADEFDPANLNPCVPSQFASACTLDSDSDGKTDADEGEATDTDADGTPDYLESASADADNDGVSDELDPANTDPCNPSQFAAPCTIDSDGDGKTDAVESETADTDGDGNPDYLESAITDADNDGVPDELDQNDSDPCIPDVAAETCDIPSENVPLPLWALIAITISLLSIAVTKRRFVKH